MRNKGKRLASRCVGLYAPGGLRGALLEYAKAHPPLVINLHWDWAPHAHLAMAYDEKVMPLGEFVWGGEVPKSYLTGPYLQAPDWPGIYKID